MKSPAGLSQNDSAAQLHTRLQFADAALRVSTLLGGWGQTFIGGVWAAVETPAEGKAREPRQDGFKGSESWRFRHHPFARKVSWSCSRSQLCAFVAACAP